MSWDGGMMGGGGLTDDDVYAAMAAATAHSQAAAEVHRYAYLLSCCTGTSKFSQGGVEPCSPCSQ